jgi:hypothetical protein
MEQAFAVPRTSANPARHQPGRERNTVLCDQKAQLALLPDPRSANARARVYSLIESAKANGIEPQAYLMHLFTELAKATRVQHIESLLPWNKSFAAGPQ